MQTRRHTHVQRHACISMSRQGPLAHTITSRHMQAWIMYLCKYIRQQAHKTHACTQTYRYTERHMHTHAYVSIHGLTERNVQACHVPEYMASAYRRSHIRCVACRDATDCPGAVTRGVSSPLKDSLILILLSTLTPSHYTQHMCWIVHMCMQALTYTHTCVVGVAVHAHVLIPVMD